MLGKNWARWVRAALLAALVPCAGCCSFWEKHCAPTQPAYYAPPGGGCCCPTQTGYAAPVAQPGWTPTGGACAPCR